MQTDIPDGLEVIAHEMPRVVELIARSARWVHPDIFHALPVWYPETARRQPIYAAGWSRQMTNTPRGGTVAFDKFEANERAGKALAAAFGLGSRKPPNWTVCHIWGYDDPKFGRSGGVVRDPRYYSCVANMVWLPTPLKGFTDAVDEIKLMLRVCAFHLYGWVCEHDEVREQAALVRSGQIPAGYPDCWPTADRRPPHSPSRCCDAQRQGL